MTTFKTFEVIYNISYADGMPDKPGYFSFETSSPCLTVIFQEIADREPTVSKANLIDGRTVAAQADIIPLHPQFNINQHEIPFLLANYHQPNHRSGVKD